MTFLQKSVKVVKDYFFILALVVTFIGFSAFKTIEIKHQSPDWYEVQLKNPSQPDSDLNREVISEGNSDQDCDQDNGDICAVGLNVSGIPSGTLTALHNRIADEDEENPTIAEFIAAGASVMDEAFKTP